MSGLHKYTVMRTPEVSPHLGPYVEPDVWAPSDDEAIKRLRAQFRSPISGNRRPKDIILMRGPDSDVVVHTATIAELQR